MGLQPISVGRTVFFFHNRSENEAARIAAQNRTEFAPAIVTKVNADSEGNGTVNLHVFIDGHPSFTAFDVKHEDAPNDSEPYWAYPPKVEAPAEEKAPAKPK